ncbi:hypothetical protein AXF42_Ash018046 [Apostasia shenzhenica]|uniref:Retrotransposon gag domain-containing protein n=1 Tax=Apostasia shenzhenica TaxID=1088818 RepID=A0A2I0AVM1_9ASPA|nr:hypothetical protein AXF42_Ash018046 [Apostasia shenzhenica]
MHCVYAFLKGKTTPVWESPDPLAAEEWIDQLEIIFEFIECPDNKKIGFASYMLTGEGRKWWKSQLNIEFKYLKPVPWERFRDNFFQQYFPPTIKEKKLRDFIHLKQGSISIMEYEAAFTAFSDYARHLVADPKEKAKKFEDSLRKDIQKQTNVMRIYYYAELYQRALIAKTDKCYENLLLC